MLQPLRKLGAKPHALWLSILAATALPASAQELGILDEILVTAQKRVESLQDVPISANVVTGDTLTKIDINNFEEMQFTVPNFNLTRTALSTQVYVRGIGSGNSAAIEQSVGTYIDGVYYGRQRQLRTPFFDLDRIEVLRGPHNTLLGKNTIAGALNVSTNRPTDSFEGEVAYTAGQYGQNDVQALVSGPLSDNVRGRLVGRFYENDGFMEDLVLNDSVSQEREHGVRGTLEWDINYDAKLTLKAEYSDVKIDGGYSEIILDEANGIGPVVGPTFFQAVVGASGGLIVPFAEADLDRKTYLDSPVTELTETFSYVANFEYEMSPFTFTSVTSYTGYDRKDGFCDCDFTAAPVVNARGEQDEYTQASQEFRLTSPVGNTVDWIGGLFYQQGELEVVDYIDVPAFSLLGASLPGVLGTSAKRDFAVESNLWAVFAQATWNITDTFRLTLGGRYTEEEKDATKFIDIVTTSTDQAVATAGAEALSWGGLGVQSRQIGSWLSPDENSGTRDEESFTPSFNVQWDAWTNGLLYASYNEGFKAGGFDTRSNNVASFEFEEEDSKSYELGAKTGLWNGRADLGIAVYHSIYDDLQISQADGGVGFNVGNAEETIVQGLEIDGRLALSRDLTARYSFAYLDFEYSEFTQAECYVNQNGAAARCDISGQEYGFTTPDYTAYLALDYLTAVSTEVDFAFSVSTYHSDNYNAHVTFDPDGARPAYTWVDLRMGFATEDWELAVLGKNVTNEDVVTYSGNVPLSDTITAAPAGGNPAFASSTLYGVIAPPVTWSLQGKWKF